MTESEEMRFKFIYLVSHTRYDMFVNWREHGKVSYENGLCLIYKHDGNGNFS